MRSLLANGAIMLAACLLVAPAQLNADDPITPIIELRSRPLTPGLELDECPRPIHQIRFLVDAKLARGRLVLDGNEPEFNEFGGIQTPQVGGKGDPQLAAQLDCNIELMKEGPKKWRLYRISGPKIRTPLRIATTGSIADGGPSRLVVLGPGGKVKAVVPCTRYGLVIP